MSCQQTGEHLPLSSQVRLAALKREEDELQRERQTLEAAKLVYIKCAPHFVQQNEAAFPAELADLLRDL